MLNNINVYLYLSTIHIWARPFDVKGSLKYFGTPTHHTGYYTSW